MLEIMNEASKNGVTLKTYTSFAVDSEGNEIENPRCAEKSADKMAKLQQSLARAVRGSNSCRSLKDKIAKLHKRINCQRDDFLHKLSRMYVNNFDIICVEDLDVKGLTEIGHNNGMHRSIHDASWSKFLFMLFPWTFPSWGAADDSQLHVQGSKCWSKADKSRSQEHHPKVFRLWKHRKERSVGTST